MTTIKISKNFCHLTAWIQLTAQFISSFFSITNFLNFSNHSLTPNYNNEQGAAWSLSQLQIFLSLRCNKFLRYPYHHHLFSDPSSGFNIEI